MATNTLHVSCKSTKPDSQWTDSGFDGKILAHHAKAGYHYPTIRLPFAFSGLIGLLTRIYQTVHQGALAFLVVVSPRTENADSADRPDLLHGENQEFESLRAHLLFRFGGSHAQL